MAARYQEIAADLRRLIDAGTYPPGTQLPVIKDIAGTYEVALATAEKAIQLLALSGYVSSAQRGRWRGTYVLERRPVQVPFSRYSRMRTEHGPWETACRLARVDGEMVVDDVRPEPAPADVAHALQIKPGTEVFVRYRHARIGNGAGRTVQLQTAYYPAHLTVAMDRAKHVGGTYRALTRSGHAPATRSETVSARPPTADEMAEMDMRAGNVLVIEATTTDAGGQPIEFIRIIADANYTRLEYDGLPLPAREIEGGAGEGQSSP